MSLLRVEIPEAGYGKKIILKEISISIEVGETLALIGPNGSGKSTLLKVLMGLLPAKNFVLEFNGIDISKRSTEERVKSGVCMVPQGNRVFTELTVKENFEIGAYLLNDDKTITSRIDSVIQLFPDLREQRKQNAGFLSGGEKQQLALARALILQPRFLLLDEPSLGLSPPLTRKAFDTIKTINDNLHTTILIVEQKVRDVFKIADRYCGLRMGRIVSSGAPNDEGIESELKKIFQLG